MTSHRAEPVVSARTIMAADPRDPLTKREVRQPTDITLARLAPMANKLTSAREHRVAPPAPEIEQVVELGSTAPFP
jgi:hypothetical protein